MRCNRSEALSIRQLKGKEVKMKDEERHMGEKV